MALRKIISSMVIVTCHGWTRWGLQLQAKPTAPSVFGRTSKVCVASRHARFTESELLSRSKFLASEFQCSDTDMYHFLSCNQQLVTMGKEKFHKMTKLLAQHGITKKELFIYPNVYRRKYETVASRIEQLEEGKVRPVTLRMINTTCKTYQSKYGQLIIDAEAFEKYQSSKDLLCLELGFTEEEAKDVINESFWLSNTKLSTLKEKVELLWSFGVSSEAIKDRIWVLAFRTSTIKSRLEDLKQAGIVFEDFPKRYLTAIKSSDEKFIEFKARLILDKAVLATENCRDKEEYICQRLLCSPKELEEMCRKFTTLLSVRLPKLKSNLDLLLDEFHLPPSIIKDWPRILGKSTETLQSRLEELQALDMPVTGKALYITKREFHQFILRIKF